MPLPIPFYLRTSQTAALTHAQLDGNLSILSTKIDNTTCNNVGTGVGIFESKEIGANDGIINLYSLSGTNGISVGVSGTTLVIDGGGAADSDWVTNGNDIYNGNTGNVGIGTDVPTEKLHVSGDTLSEGDIYLPDDYKLRIGGAGDLLIYHDGINSYIGEVGSGNLLLSGTELKLNDSSTGKSFLQGNSALSNVKLYWSGETRTTTGEDGLILNKTISGTPVANLSIRADGTIITGSTAVPVGTSFSTNASIDPNVSIYDTISYTTTLPGGTIYIGDSNSFPVGHKKTLIRISTTNSAFIGTTGSSTINGSATKALPTAVYSVTTCIANGNVWYCSTGTVL